jgi:hypothetical protein
MGLMRNACRILADKHQKKILFGRLRRRWEDCIEMNFKEILYEGVDWIYLLRIGTSGELL